MQSALERADALALLEVECAQTRPASLSLLSL